MGRCITQLKRQLAAVLTGAGLLASSSACFALSPDQLYEKVSPSVWVVIAPLDASHYESGSAVVIAPHLLVTNCHVINHGKFIEVRHQGVRHVATLAAADPERDLCTLRAPDVNAPPIQISPLSSVRVGQRIYTVGAPGGYELTLSDGLVSGLLHDRGSSRIAKIQISAPISHGSSGGGLFNEDGNLIGITSAMVQSAENLNFAIPAEWVAQVSGRSHLAANGAMSPNAAAPEPELLQNPPRLTTVAETPSYPPALQIASQQDPGVADNPPPALPPGYGAPTQSASPPPAQEPDLPPAPTTTTPPAAPVPGYAMPPTTPAPQPFAAPRQQINARVITGAEFMQWMSQLHDFNAQTPAHSVMHISLAQHTATITNTTLGASASATFAIDRAHSWLCLSEVAPQSFAPMQTCYRMLLRGDRILELQSIDSPYHLRMRVVDETGSR